MTNRRLIVLFASLALLTSSALAGSPDNPGAGGQGISATVEEFRQVGVTWGSAVSEFVRTSDKNVGDEVRNYKGDGGFPNPANDNGGGND